MDQKHYRMLLNVCRKLLIRSRLSAITPEDLAQDAWISMRKQPLPEDDGHKKALFTCVAARRLVDIRRTYTGRLKPDGTYSTPKKGKRIPLSLDSFLSKNEERQDSIVALDASAAVDTSFEVYEIIDTLPDDISQSLRLWIAGYTLREICKATGVKDIRTISAKLVRAREMIRQAMFG